MLITLGPGKEHRSERFHYGVNIGTPFEEKDFEALRAWIDSHPAPIMANGLYHSFLTEFHQIHRDGFLFLMWFNTREPAEEFAAWASQQPFGKFHKTLPVIENFPPNSPNARYRVMEALYCDTEWWQKQQAELARRATLTKEELKAEEDARMAKFFGKTP